jgi:hypothetical protein
MSVNPTPVAGFSALDGITSLIDKSLLRRRILGQSAPRERGDGAAQQAGGKGEEESRISHGHS